MYVCDFFVSGAFNVIRPVRKDEYCMSRSKLTHKTDACLANYQLP
jgi:hypothetical protein